MSKKYHSADVVYPLKDLKRLVFLKNIVKNPQIIVGDYTYYDDSEVGGREINLVPEPDGEGMEITLKTWSH